MGNYLLDTNAYKYDPRIFIQIEELLNNLNAGLVRKKIRYNDKSTYKDFTSTLGESLDFSDSICYTARKIVNENTDPSPRYYSEIRKLTGNLFLLAEYCKNN